MDTQSTVVDRRNLRREFAFGAPVPSRPVDADATPIERPPQRREQGSADRFRRVMDLFTRAVELPVAERRAFLDAVTASDSALRAEIDAMLAADEAPVATVGGGARALVGEIAAGRDLAGGTRADRLATETAGDGSERRPGLGGARREPVPVLVGEYRIIRLIGEGGMGTVYEAEQAMPRRRVAIKVVRSSFASRRILRRFAHEAHILGRLHHPGIAQIYEAGAGDAEKPDQAFFVMEFVDGVPLTSYADRHGLDRDARLHLVAKVGDAVAHAHQRGVIHRDLKPVNILVDATGQPKVLDFGVARVTDGDAEISTQLTSIGQLVGTLPYMSPEQVAGDPDEVDVRSDVYALGVILYELLAGALPVDVARRSIPDAARAIREVEPPRLGSRARDCRGDVETIVHKALEKDRDRRYQSAQELVADIRRYLGGEPIIARQHSAMYVIRKQLRRYQGAVAAAALVAIGLSTFSVYAWIQSARNAALAEAAEAARGRAEQEAQRADASATDLAERLSISRIERGGLFGRTGNLPAAEDLLWPEFLRDPSSSLAYEALAELYMYEPCVMTRSIAPGATSENIIRAVAANADATVAACGGDDGRVTLLSASDGAILTTVVEPGDVVRSIAILPSGDVAVGTLDGHVVLRNSVTLEELARMPAHRGAVRGVAALAGDDLLTFGDDRMIRRWNRRETAPRREWPAGGAGTGFAATMDGALVVAGCSDGAVRLFDAEGRSIIELRGHVGAVSSVAISPDGATVFSGGADRTVRFWDVDGRRQIDAVRRPNGTVRGIGVTPDGQTLVTTGWWLMDIWDIPTRTVRRTFSQQDGPTMLSIVDGGRAALTVHSADVVRLWEIAVDAQRRTMSADGGSASVSATRDGRFLACGDDTGRVALLHADDLRVAGVFAGISSRPRTLEFSPDGSMLAGVVRNGTLVVWSVPTGEIIGQTTRIGSESAVSFAWHPTRPMLIACGQAGSYVLLDIPSMRELLRFPGSAQSLSVAWLPDGESFIGVSRSPVAAHWNIDGTLRRELTAPEGQPIPGTLWCPAVSDDGRTLALGTWEKTVRLHDLASGTYLGELTGHAGLVGVVEFSRNDPNLLMSASADGTMRLWDVKRRQNVLTLPASPGWEVSDAAFSADDRQVVIASASGEVARWDLRHSRRHIAGNLAHQIARRRVIDPEGPEAQRLLAWADEVLAEERPAAEPAQ